MTSAKSFSGKSDHTSMASRTNAPKDERIRALERDILRHQDLYYRGLPEISDYEFDLLWDELKALDPGNRLFTQINSELEDGFPKAEHLIPMGSQEKAADPDSFRVWAEKQESPDFLVQYKLDGASLELQYEEGFFLRAVTRGDGKIGDDITENARKMKGLVKTVPLFSGGIRCEVIMTRDTLKRHFTDKANCRNAANGIMKRKDGAGCEHLELICYDVTRKDAPFADEAEKINWLASRGFTPVPMTECIGADEVIAYRESVMAMRSDLPYDIDGLVVKTRAVDPEDLAKSRPEKQIAFKFNLEEAVSTLRKVEWSESGATYTPIALIDPVQLAGTTVQRANLSNPNMIRSLDLRIGSRVIVTKRGEIIPKIEALLENPSGTEPIAQPTTCSCGTTLADEGTRLFCPSPSCPKRIHHRLEKWISTLDVRDIGVTLIERLFASGRVRSIPDFYTLTLEELSTMDRMGELSAAKVLRSLEAKKEISLSRFIAGFDIDGIGETMVEKLVDAGYDTIESLFTATEDDFSQVYQFGKILAAEMVRSLASLKDEMTRLLEMGAIIIKRPPASSELPLTGKSFCFTGELASMKRSEAEALITELGGKAKSSVTKDLSFLVTNDPASGSSKNEKARALGVAILDEKAFLSLIGKEEGAI